MDLRYTDAEQAFRSELRAWLAEVLPGLPPKPPPGDWPGRRAYDTHWQRLLFEAGYAGVDWPVEGGGRGSSAIEELIFKEELERAHAPYVGVNFVGLLHAGPTVIAEGTSAQRQRYLPPILKGEEVWCQGFSEPDAGSDLASMRTRAVRDGDEYVVNGSKIWTSHAEVADNCELLVRTGAEDSRHRGISWLILPMDTPGVEIRPLSTIAGSTEFAELFLDDVRVPVANRVGDENDGWRVTMVTLSFERGTAFVGDLLEAFELLTSTVELARRTGAWDDPSTRRQAGHLRAELDALWALTKRNVSQAARTGIPGVGGTFFKLAYSETRHKLGEFSLSLLGRAGLAASDSDAVDGGDPLPAGTMVEDWLRGISLTIAAGTSQIQRNIVGERILGLPKEPLVTAPSKPLAAAPSKPGVTAPSKPGAA
jgi:alkylation response protein AidB-like acyl-CoA dehydrogenase